jgi:cytochrome d ubiquinol oxidase subunit I
MNDVLIARAQMGISLAFHILFSVVGMAMPILMVAAEWRFWRTGDDEYLELAKMWAKGTAVLFAIGAVSGTVLSFELGLLFPTFMKHAGAVVGLPFSLEGFAFFTEAIFLGVYLYGWDRVSRRVHLAAGVVVAFSGIASAAFVTIANAWMNAPRGFRVENGVFVDIDPMAAMATPFAAHEVIHMTLAAYMTTALAAAALHAWAILRGKRRSFHAKALGIALALAVPSSLVQPMVGHVAGEHVAEHQPLKMAAMEQLEHTQAWAPVSVGPIAIPGLLSILAKRSPSAVVTGLDAFPPEDRPHAIVKVAFQGMVAIGTALAGLASWVAFLWWKKRPLADNRRLLQTVVLSGPMGFVALEMGWVVTEMGRQPWVIYGVMRTKDAVTPMPGLIVPFTTFAILYLVLGLVTATVLRDLYKKTLVETP